MVTGFISESANGIYAVSYKLPTILTLVSGIFMEAWQFSAVSESVGDRREHTRFFSRVWCAFQAVMFLAAAGNAMEYRNTAAGAEAANTAATDKTQKQKMNVMNRISMASDKLAGSSIYIDDTPGLTIQEMRGKARRLKAKGGLDLIVIDYLQLMQAPDRRTNSENRQHEVSEISRGLKALARELNVPVLALSQLSRSVETRQVKKPMLSDLRESGSLEQDADIVMFLYREDYYKNAGASPVHLTELIIAKHRNGPTGKVNLFFKNDCTKFIGLNERDAV